MKNTGIFFIILFWLTSCGISPEQTVNNNSTATPYALQTSIVKDDFNQYWYAGEAEISSYDLQQVRYGEIHPGNAVLVFVTEPFSKDKQVKLDYPQKNPADNISVLKLNATRKFNTGIYPYSTIQSIFTPVSLDKYPATLKVATSSQEWCGHTFEQLNLDKNGYTHRLFSYFESEGDIENKLDKAYLEDELMNRIRINPEALPVGNVEVIPSTIYSRFAHKPLKAEKAIISLEKTTKTDQLLYQINYPKIGRSLLIYFDQAFPHIIQSWEEHSTRHPNLITKATRKKTIKSDYWNKNRLKDSLYRDELGLE